MTKSKKKLKELKAVRDSLFNQLLDSDISPAERVEVRSQYYKANSQLYYTKAAARKISNHGKR